MVICCVAGCGNRSGRDDVSFYSIPSETRDPARRKAFIWAAGRMANNRPTVLWKPTTVTRICSAHFVGGQKSEDPSSPAYVPTEKLPVTPLGSKSFCPSTPKRRKCHLEDIDEKEKSDMEEMMDVSTDFIVDVSSQEDWFTFLWTVCTALFFYLFAIMLCVDTNQFQPKPSVTQELDREVETEGEHSYSRKWDTKSNLEDLEKRNLWLETKLKVMEGRLLLIDNIRTDDKLMKFYTGLPNYGTFRALFHYLQPKASRLRYVNTSYEKECQRPPKSVSRERKIDLEHEFLMTLVRLKQGMFEIDLARNFDISQGHCSKIINTWLDYLYCELKSICTFPSADKVNRTTPKSFRKYPNTRIVLDCTEEFIERPSNINSSKSSYSHYKNNHTLKFLIGMAPNGYVSFISPAWGGRASDKLITNSSDLYSQLDIGDSVMVDRGFDIEAELKDKGVALNIPAFKGQRGQLNASEVQNSMRIAQVRIHVERLIGRIKTFHILDRELRLSMHDRLEQIFVICAYLTNFQTPILKPDDL